MEEQDVAEPAPSYIESIKHTQYLMTNLIHSDPSGPFLCQEGLWDLAVNLSTWISELKPKLEGGKTRRMQIHTWTSNLETTRDVKVPDGFVNQKEFCTSLHMESVGGTREEQSQR